MFPKTTIKEFDPELWSAICQEDERQEHHVELVVKHS